MSNLLSGLSWQAGASTTLGSSNLPTFRSLSSVVAGAAVSNTSVTPPSGIVDNDILIASFSCGQSAGAPTVTPPAGWTEVAGSPTTVNDPNSFYVQLHTFWKRASSESGNYTFTHTAAITEVVIAAYSGCITSGNPVDNVSFDTGVSTANSTATILGVITTRPNDLLIYTGHNWADVLASRSPPAGFTERFDNFVYLADATLTAPGATGNYTQDTQNTVGVGHPWATSLLSLKGAGRAQAISTSASVNPRIYKGPFTITNGKVYKFNGTLFKGTAGVGSAYIRVSTTNLVVADGPVNNNYAADQDMSAISFTATYTGDAYLGIIPLVNAIGQYSEITDAFIVDDGNALGTLTLTEVDDSVSSASTLAIHGSLSVTADNDTISATGQGSFWASQGAVTKTELDDTASGTGTIALKGTTSKTEDNDTFTIMGASSINGTSSTTDQDDALLAHIIIPPCTGGFAYFEADDTVSATSTIQAVAFGVVNEAEGADDTGSSTGTVFLKGSVNVTEASDTIFDIAGVKITGTYNKTEDNDTTFARGGVPPWKPSTTTSTRPYRLSS